MSATKTRTSRAAEDWAPAFVRELARGEDVRSACRAIGVGRSTVYRHRETDPDFAEAWDNALAAATEHPDAPTLEPVDVPASVNGTGRLYRHPALGEIENPTRYLQRRIQGGVVTVKLGTVVLQPIGPDGICPACGWFIPQDRRWKHETRRDERLDFCPNQRDDLTHGRRTVRDFDPLTVQW